MRVVSESELLRVGPAAETWAEQMDCEIFTSSAPPSLAALSR